MLWMCITTYKGDQVQAVRKRHYENSQEHRWKISEYKQGKKRGNERLQFIAIYFLGCKPRKRFAQAILQILSFWFLGIHMRGSREKEAPFSDNTSLYLFIRFERSCMNSKEITQLSYYLRNANLDVEQNSGYLEVWHSSTHSNKVQLLFYKFRPPVGLWFYPIKEYTEYRVYLEVMWLWTQVSSLFLSWRQPDWKNLHIPLWPALGWALESQKKIILQLTATR